MPPSVFRTKIISAGILFLVKLAIGYFFCLGPMKEITHLRHFFENIVNNFTIQFFILFSETLIISQTKSWASQNNKV